MRQFALLAAAALSIGLGGAAVDAKPGASSSQPALAAALSNSHRTEADRARDRYRHPAETLSFCRIQPGQKVVDYMPGGGWWTRILPYYLGEQGHYIALNPDVRNAPDRMRSNFSGTAEKFPAGAAAWTGLPATRFTGYNSDGLPPAAMGTVDRVMIMRQVHNLNRFGFMFSEMTTIRHLLKPDGLVCIEEHRARPNASPDFVDGSKGYMREKDVIALMQAHGFELVAKSEINANRRDPADWPEGVWTLPPSLRGVTDEALKARVTAIGESDRMTLLFRKRG
ncbi:MAG: class I SAM-dependent methyltransferase [Novosphingobium sp.]